jgi:hypothetical protein
MSGKDDFSTPVRTDPAPRRSTRRDPDAAPPATVQPAAAPPVTHTPPPAAPSPGNPAAGETLADVFTSVKSGDTSVSEGVAALSALAGMRRKAVDPFRDWVPDGNRLPRFVSNAIRQTALLTGAKVQDVHRDAVLGIRPLPEDVLDANWLDLYGYPRSQYNAEAYR